VTGVQTCALPIYRSDGKISNFSSKNKSVDVAAPGEDMAGLSYSKNNEYKVGGDGTSFAAPVVAAAAAIARQLKPDLTASGFMDLLKATVSDAGTKGYDTSFGYGKLDIAAIVKSLDKPEAPSSPSLQSGKNSILISFDANGGKLAYNEPKNRAVSTGTNYGTLPVATKKGNALLGWYTAKKGGTKVSATKPVTVSKNQTLYAHWTKAYTVKFNSAGGSKVASKTIVAKKAVSKLTTPKKNGYKFKGWYTKKSGGKKISKKTKITKNITYYAQWKKK
jgi:uncharacterized repeat protein (TIGR02543 family)